MALTLLAPGSTDPRHARDVAALSARLKLAGIATAVCHLDHHGPSPADAARGLVRAGAPSTTLVPLLISPDYHARVDVPAAVRSMRSAAPELGIAAAEPIGLNPELLDACAELADEAQLPIDDRTGVILASAGSRDLRVVAAIEGLVRRFGPGLRDRLGARSVRVAHLEGGRPIGAVRTLMQRIDGAQRFVVLPVLLTDGRTRDRVVVAAERYDLPVLPGSLARTNTMADLVVMRAGSAPAPTRDRVAVGR
jgi:sirohydrochlorin ferrochelatase